MRASGSPHALHAFSHNFWSNMKLDGDVDSADSALPAQGDAKKKKKTKILITAVPPHEMKRWKALTIEPNLQMVESYPLMHVYGLVKDFGQKQVKQNKDLARLKLSHQHIFSVHRVTNTNS